MEHSRADELDLEQTDLGVWSARSIFRMGLCKVVLECGLEQDSESYRNSQEKRLLLLRQGVLATFLIVMVLHSLARVT